MIARDEAVKIQLVEAHKYVQQFMSLRVTAFGTTVGFVGAVLAVIYKVEASPHARLSLWAFELLILLFASQLLGAMGRSVWLFCAHMFMMERDLYGPGGNHQWIMANLLDRRYSSTYGLFVALLALNIAVCTLFAVDVLAQPFSPLWKSVLLGFIFLGCAVLTRLAIRDLEPRGMIKGAIEHAIRSERLISRLEQGPPGDDAEDAGTDRLTPYLRLLEQWRSRATGGSEEGKSSPCAG